MIDSELLEITWIAAFLLKKVTAISHTQKWKSVWKKDNKRKDYFECFKLDFTVCLETTVTRFFSVSRSYQSTKSPWVNPASHPFTMSCNFSVHNPGMNILYPSSHIQCWQDLVYTWFVWLELQYEAWKGKTMPVHNISKKWECMAEEDLHLSTRKNVHWLDQCPALVMKCLLPENKQHKTLYFSIIMCKNILLCVLKCWGLYILIFEVFNILWKFLQTILLLLCISRFQQKNLLTICLYGHVHLKNSIKIWNKRIQTHIYW